MPTDAIDAWIDDVRSRVAVLAGSRQLGQALREASVRQRGALE